MRWASKLLHPDAKIPGVADAHILQVLTYPALKVDVDRQRAAEVGVNQRDVANNLADLAVVQRRRFALLLSQPGQWRELPRRRADAAGADRRVSPI